MKCKNCGAGVEFIRNAFRHIQGDATGSRYCYEEYTNLTEATPDYFGTYLEAILDSCDTKLEEPSSGRILQRKEENP